jgi:hypothetical protein
MPAVTPAAFNGIIALECVVDTVLNRTKKVTMQWTTINVCTVHPHDANNAQIMRMPGQPQGCECFEGRERWRQKHHTRSGYLIGILPRPVGRTRVTLLSTLARRLAPGTLIPRVKYSH